MQGAPGLPSGNHLVAWGSPRAESNCGWPIHIQHCSERRDPHRDIGIHAAAVRVEVPRQLVVVDPELVCSICLDTAWSQSSSILILILILVPSQDSIQKAPNILFLIWAFAALAKAFAGKEFSRAHEPRRHKATCGPYATRLDTSHARSPTLKLHPHLEL